MRRHRLRWVAAGAAVLAMLAPAPSYAVSAPDRPAVAVDAVDASHGTADQDPTRATGPGLYLVTLTSPPAAAYDGGVPGLRATRPPADQRFDRTRSAVREYTRWLTAQQDRVLAEIGDPEVVYRFTTAVNGFAAELSSAQVKQLRGTTGVALVEKESMQQLDTVESPGFLGLDGPVGAWERNGGPAEAGAGTVVGVIDSGIWPENPSFAGLPLTEPGLSEEVPGFHGACQGGESWRASDCTEKVISARYFVKGFGEQNLSNAEYLSPRDGSGHGSHAAAVAAGNHGVNVQIEGQGFGEASGMAPAARIAAYKACWIAPQPENDGCSTVDTVAAIDRAVADGVDVISYSISGSDPTLADTVSLSFLNASAAGVFVATSAGNRGPEPASVSHPSPWVTTVAASTHQLFQGAVELGDGSRYVGAMISDQAVPSSPLVLSAEAAAPTASANEARLCEVGSLDAEVVQDSIVVCDRGVIARVDKSAAVARAGGVGMILVNTIPDTRASDFHSVPTVHLGGTDGREVKEYVEEAGDDATASIHPSGSEEIEVPQVAGFSARGPVPAAEDDLLKPDLTAPGVSVVSAVAPPSSSGRLWDIGSGTSVSAPHVAGLAAFAQGVHPSWSPAAVKSAMMTTAYDLEGGVDRFAQGAGHVDPTAFLEPGLVFEAGVEDWLGFLRGQGFAPADGSPVAERPLDAVDLNLPSIAVGNLVGRTTVERTVTNVSGRTSTYSAVVTGLNGVTAEVSPSTLLLEPGESATFRVSFVVGPDAQPGTFTDGSLTLTGLTGKDVAIPVAVRPQALDAPDEVSVTGRSGVTEVTGRSGVDDAVDPEISGLVGALPTDVSLTPGSFDPTAPTRDGDTLATTIEVPEDTKAARFSVDGTDSGDDLDLFVYLDDELVGVSASGAADETVTLVDPEAGSYDVYVSSVSAADGTVTEGELYTWVISSAASGNLTMSPDPVRTTPGRPFSFTLSWEDLGGGERWFGVIGYGSTDERTFVTVD